MVNLRHILLDRISRIANYFVHPNVSADQQRRRSFLFLFLLISIVISAISMAIGANSTGIISVEALLPFSAIVTGIGSLVALRYLKNIVLLFTITIIYYGFALIYVLLIGTAQGTTHIWLYVYPLIAYFLMGKNWGSVMVAFTWVASTLIVLFNLGYHVYPFYLRIQFVMSYSLVWVLAYGMEASREYYYRRLQRELQTVEEALEQVKTLQNLLPICASCKKIRDDSGYWHQVESYMHNYAGVEFSHSICPDCRDSLYPSLRKLR